MIVRKIALAAIALGALFALGAPSASADGPAWRLEAIAMPTVFTPGSTGEIFLTATNVGAAPAEGTIEIADVLPPALTVVRADRKDKDAASPPSAPCDLLGQTVTCSGSGPIRPGYAIEVVIKVEIDPLAPEGGLVDQASVESDGAVSAHAATPLRIGSSPALFDFLPGGAGLSAPFSEADGGVATQAGSHPYQLTVALGFPTRSPNGVLTGAGRVRDASSDLPRGTIVDPSATPVLCTEAQLITESPGCPPESQIGTVTITTVGVTPEAATSPLFNMVPPPGKASSFGFDALLVGVFAHVFGSVRSDGDYGLSGGSDEILALPAHPIFGVRLELWGDPSAPSHDGIRGTCNELQATPETCPVPPQNTAFLTVPGECTGSPVTTQASAESWEEPGVLHHASYQSADLEGNPVSVSGCAALQFEPTLKAQPTTNLADSPSGLDVDLHQPQNTELGENDEGRSTAALKDAKVTLPAGMVANPSQADGLGSCSKAQIGLMTQVGETPVHFDKTPNSCPAAAKLGSVEVTTPLLAEYEDEGTKLATDPETGLAIPRPLHGSLYLAQPFENPFGSLLAIYLTVEDPQSGTVAKLAGRIEPDPQTGQLTTVFEENPQLPLEDIRLHLFGGARAPLITPPACGTHTTTTDLLPWSSPEGEDAHPASSFQLTAAPGGGACPQSADQLPNTPSFAAGTLTPQAGAYSPFVLKLSREDGSQRLAGFDSLLPPGLTGKLAGIATCPDAALAKAASRSNPNEGVLERNDPSCPQGSALGTVTIGAGAGPNPFYTQGTAYLAGPYKGAPLSMAVITPAIAGPFDLGTVVVRAALYVDPTSARIHAVSDPFPQILHGIPLDLRSVAVKLDRPSFTLNPTSCDPMQIAANVLPALGSPATLANPFQVGGCSSLAFKPKLAIKLTGGTRRSKNPALKATLTMPPGGANIAKASVALPHSEFLDQAHIRTVCTRVQFAAGPGNGAGCPAGSVYGRARAITPLLDSPLEGPVYLRSSNHLLPDLVAALHGQIDVALLGRVDSHNGGIRTTFEGVPDAPVSKFVLEMQGGKKGLLENSTNLCRSTHRATALFDAQNGKTQDFNPVVQNGCRGKPKRTKGGR